MKIINFDRLLKSLNLKSERPMKFPYTTAAQLMQFPYAYHWKNQWTFRYYFYAIILSAPVFYKIGRLANNESNVQKWKEIKQKEQEHLKHRWD
ncbi:uncharacterized protein LOC123680801 [Harmonia axyridis]|uniref:uncharacterized protein LOC123680801 n=1 Tax=Harmonia axyridis TaxID=115357 RepID=UPI001E276F77|nr:uncharacterized protein LOC123680801 [Harmonia axyridis]